ncbi:MAG: sugar phosphate nucleotidyltransferase [Bacteroidales bacterium]|jgi:NDP-sugar pyrophosphorylase family protein
MKSMIFAAGKGKRLGAVTATRPKALVEINGKTILRMAVELVASHGFNDIIINVHHFADLVENEIKHLRSEGFKISVSDERDMLLETGGGLFIAKWFFDKEPFLLYNTDIITDLDLAALYRFHKMNNGIATLAVAERNDNRVFLINREGIICGWLNRKTGERIISRNEKDPLTEIAFSGIHIVSPDIFNYMNEGVYSMTSLYLQLGGSHEIFTYRHDNNFWADIGTPDDLELVRSHFGDKNL